MATVSAGTPSASDTLVLEARPDSRRLWFRDLRAHSEVLVMLARKDFQTRYKRASFGLLWAVAVPSLQAIVMAVVFSRLIKAGATGHGYGIYVMSGIIAYWYFSTALSAASTAIVDGATLTDKVWFPRLLLPVVPTVSNLVGLAVTVLVLLIAMPILGVPESVRTPLLIPALVLLVAFTVSLSLCLSALHVYFRDVKFLTQAALLVWLYLTPILYPAKLLGTLRHVIEANPLTGIVTLFHMATVGQSSGWQIPLIVSGGTTAVLLIVGLEAQRRHDRLFVDLL